MKLQIFKVVAFLTLLAGSFSCSKDGPKLSSEHTILSFEHPNLIKWEILNDGKEIYIRPNLTVCQMALTWKAGTDLTSLVPVIAIPFGAIIIPNPNIPQDFSDQVSYTVIAEDGITILTYLIASRTED